MKIISRLLMTFLGLAILVLLMSFIVPVGTVNSSKVIFDTIQTETLPQQTALNQVETSLFIMVIGVHKIIEDPSEDSITRYEQVREVMKQASRAYERLASERNEASEINDQVQAIADASDEVVGLVTDGAPEQQVAARMESLDVMSDALIASIDSLRESELDELAEAFAAIHASINQTYYLLIVVSIIVIFAVSAIGWMVSLSLSRSLVLLRNAAHEISRGNFVADTFARGPEEIVRLGISLGAMRDKIRENKEQLEKTIAERTRELKESNEKLEKERMSLVQANEKLVQQDRLKSEFINLAAHELRTPILPILLRAEDLREDLPGNDTVNIILRNANRLNNLANAILEASKIESNSLKLDRVQTDMAAVIAGVAKDFKGSDKKVHIKCDAEKIVLDIDREK